MNSCDSVEPDWCGHQPDATLESLGGDKWLCTCEWDGGACEFINACDVGFDLPPGNDS